MTEQTNISFLIDEKEHSLYKAQKAIDKEVIAAIQFLASVVNDDSKTTDQRLRAAEKLLDNKLKISESMNKDFLQRLVLEAKKNIPVLPRKYDPEGEPDQGDSMPAYNPSIILDVSSKSSV